MLELTILGLILSCFAAIGAKSLSDFSKHRLQEFHQQTSAKKNKLDVIKKNDKRAALAVSMFLYLCVSLTVMSGILWFLKKQDQLPKDWDYVEWGTMLAVLTFVLIALLVWIPTTFSRLWSASITVYGWAIWQFLIFCFYPLELCAKFIDAICVRLSGQKPDATEEEQFSEKIMTIVSEGRLEGLLEDDAREMIEGVIELRDVVVSEIMTPRTDMYTISKTLSWEEMLASVMKAPHSRIPVFDANRDDIIGVIFAKDLLAELAKPNIEYRAPWTTLLREPRFVPETKPVSSLLQEFQQNHVHLVVVLDEYGGVSGVVTLEDVLEEIVGEITDEYDPDFVDGVTEVVGAEATYQVLGKVHIDELNDRLGIGFPEDDNYDTIAGFLLDRMGRVPVQGEIYDYDGLRITIVAATRRRIEIVRIEPLPEEDENSEENF
ncbi:MAG: hemolysin family protein [Planctomycetaceae bacterium]|jgi:CBS domain containing-hemolysin-like protein|nr:hemolysin family protein [Planctomycetaceae bacterium]